MISSWIPIFFALFVSTWATTPDTSNCTSGQITADCCADCFGTLPSPYTLTAIKFDQDGCADSTYYGLKIESFFLFVDKVVSYCPFTGDQASLCPNGTDMALVGDLEPLVEVPGGQDTYVDANGLVTITVQHSHAFPAGSYPYYEGWTWTPYQLYPEPPQFFSENHCNTSDPIYNCDAPTGYWTFQALNATLGGLRACSDDATPPNVSLYAVTPEFNRTDCVALDGLGTHAYSGPNPPVWAYY